MGEYHSISITERLCPSEDLSYKKVQLDKHIDDMKGCDESFLALVQNIIVGEDMSGEIVDAMRETTEQFSNENRQLAVLVSDQMSKAVQSLDQQVDDMKIQSMTITYEDNLF